MVGRRVVSSVALRRRTPIAALAAAAALLLTACSGGLPTSSGSGDAGTTGQEQPKAAPPTIKIAPAEGTTRVRPDRSVVVAATNGELESVTVRARGKVVKGAFDAARSRWRSKEPLRPGTTYTVEAKATGEGGPAEATSRFTTLKPQSTLAIADVTPAIKGETLGVGAPIIVTFNQAVKDKAAVERALHVKAEKPVPGAWRWVSDNQVIYRTAKFWPAHQKVTFTARLTGVRSGPGTWGTQDSTTVLKIGAAWISTVNVKTHMMIVRKDGKVVQRMPISAGKATTREYTTTSGIHLTMERGSPVVMTSPGRKEGDPGYYREVVDHAVRISSSGEYVHSAPWSVGSQGRANVSHGCINAHPRQAKWFYDNFHRGDVVKITGTNRPLEWNNGWGFWQLSFKEWKKGSALNSAR
jgi:lipoprotein-anchoring transpeptidase ErfK/SrfK